MRVLVLATVCTCVASRVEALDPAGAAPPGLATGADAAMATATHAPVAVPPIALDPRLTQVRFDLDRPGERWTLREPKRGALCVLPCTLLIPADADLHLRQYNPTSGVPLLDLKVPPLEFDGLAHPPLRTRFFRDTEHAALVGYGVTGGAITVIGGILGFIVVGILEGVRAAEKSCPVGITSSCALAGAENYELASFIGELEGFGLGLAAGAGLGALVGTAVFLGVDSPEVHLVPDKP